MTKLIIWWLRRKEKKLERRVAALYEDRLMYARKAYDIDPNDHPMQWARLQNNCNWCGFYWRRSTDELKEVKAKLERLEGSAEC